MLFLYTKRSFLTSLFFYYIICIWLFLRKFFLLGLYLYWCTLCTFILYILLFLNRYFILLLLYLLILLLVIISLLLLLLLLLHFVLLLRWPISENHLRIILLVISCLIICSLINWSWWLWLLEFWWHYFSFSFLLRFRRWVHQLSFIFNYSFIHCLFISVLLFLS
jgi:hypothetical protein